MEPSKRAPAFPLYAQDFISSLDVQMMSAAEVGAYCLLLFNSWAQPKQGYLPNDEAQLQFMSRLTAEQWKQSKKRLLNKFVLTPDRKFRYNPRLVAELAKRSAYLEKQAENGKRGGRPRREEQPQKPSISAAETQKNPTLSQPLEVAKPAGAQFSTSTSISISEPLPTVEGAGLVEEIEPWLAPPPESSSDAEAPGGAADVGTSLVPERGGRWQYEPAAIAESLVMPFESGDFRQAWVAYRTFREEDKQRQLTGGMQEQELLRKLSNLAGGDQQKAIAIIAQTIAKGWKDLYKLDEPRTPTQQPGQPERGAKPTGAASTGARTLSAQLRAVREQQRAQDGSHVNTGASAGTHAGLGSPVPPGVGAS